MEIGINKSQLDSSYAIDEEAMKPNIPNDSAEEKQETTDEGPKQVENPVVRFINKTDVEICTGLGKYLSKLKKECKTLKNNIYIH